MAFSRDTRHPNNDASYLKFSDPRHGACQASTPKILHAFPVGEVPGSMVSFDGHVYVATNMRVYRIVDDKLVPMEIVAVSEGAFA